MSYKDPNNQVIYGMKDYPVMLGSFHKHQVIQFVTFSSPSCRSRFAFSRVTEIHHPQKKGHKLAELLPEHILQYRVSSILSDAMSEGIGACILSCQPPGETQLIGAADDVAALRQFFDEIDVEVSCHSNQRSPGRTL